MDVSEQELSVAAAAHRKRGELSSDAGELDDAIEAFEQALEAEADLETTRKLADLFAKRGLDGDGSQAADLYFAVGEVLGNPEGIELLERALDEAPGHLEALQLIESFLPSEQHAERLQTRWAAFVEASNDFTEVETRRRMLVRAQAAATGALLPKSGRTMVSYRLPEDHDAPAPLSMLDGTRIPTASDTARMAAQRAAAQTEPSPAPVMPEPKAPPPVSTPPMAATRSSAPPAARPSTPPRRRSINPLDPAPLRAAPSHPFQPAVAVALARASAPPSGASPKARPSTPSPVIAAVSPPTAPAPFARSFESSSALDDELATMQKRRIALPDKRWLIGGALGIGGLVVAIAFGSSSAPAPATVAGMPARTEGVPSAAPVVAPVQPAAALAPVLTAAAAPILAAPQPAALAAKEPAPSGPAVSAMVALASVRGGKLTDSQLETALARADAKLERCYEQALKKKPRTEGRLTLSWTVRPNGRVAGVRKVGGTIDDTTLYRCTAAAITATRFPRPAKRAATVKLPIEYKRP